MTNFEYIALFEDIAGDVIRQFSLIKEINTLTVDSVCFSNRRIYVKLIRFDEYGDIFLKARGTNAGVISAWWLIEHLDKTKAEELSKSLKCLQGDNRIRRNIECLVFILSTYCTSFLGGDFSKYLEYQKAIISYEFGIE